MAIGTLVLIVVALGLLFVDTTIKATHANDPVPVAVAEEDVPVPVTATAAPPPERKETMEPYKTYLEAFGPLLPMAAGVVSWMIVLVLLRIAAAKVDEDDWAVCLFWIILVSGLGIWPVAFAAQIYHGVWVLLTVGA